MQNVLTRGQGSRSPYLSLTSTCFLRQQTGVRYAANRLDCRSPLAPSDFYGLRNQYYLRHQTQTRPLSISVSCAVKFELCSHYKANGPDPIKPGAAFVHSCVPKSQSTGSHRVYTDDTCTRPCHSRKTRTKGCSNNPPNNSRTVWSTCRY